MTAVGQTIGRRRAEGAAVRRNPMTPVVVAEVGLALLTVAAIAGLGRLYRSASFAAPLIALALAGHLLAAACRRRRIPPLGVAAIAVASGSILIVWLLFGQTTVLGIPTPHTFDVVDAAIRSAWDRFGVVVAPAPVLPGFQVVAAIAVWAGIWFADWAAFRLWAAAESLAPAGVLFVFGSMLGAPRHRVGATIIFAAAVLFFMLAHRIARQELTSTWIAAAPGSGRRALLRTGATLGMVALVGGAVLGPHLPGAGHKAVLPWRQGNGPRESRITVSPLVDIRKRLVNQSEAEAFNVRSNRPSYWRLTSLDTFDGRIWSSGGSFSAADGTLPKDHPAIRDVRRIKQQFEIGALNAIWLPAAFEASSVDPGDTRMRWDSASSTLIVDDDRRTSDGFIYNVDSEMPQFDAKTLRAASSAVPPSIRRTYLQLPQNFNQRAAQTARAVTGSALDQYDRALLLQNWFRDRFTYSLDVPAGHSEDAIAEFLASRRGYCEQFAGTYAAMARSIGLPARVAVGFTPGDVDKSDPDLYRVKGKHAHAWPEVWFANSGWVPFEPTPNRGEPGAENYTGVAPMRASDVANDGTGTTVPETTSAPSTPRTAPKLDPRKFNVNAGGSSTASTGSNQPRAVDDPVVMVILVLLAVALGYVLLVLALPFGRRARARRRAVTPSQRIALAWTETAEAVARAGSSLPYSSETHHEYASRVALALGPIAGDLRELAGMVSESAWSGTEPASVTVDSAEALGRSIRRDLAHRMTVRERVMARLDPHRLLRPKPPARPGAPGTSVRDREPVSR